MNEPPPQPRVRKITTVINTLGVVVRDSATEITVWVWTACEEKSFPKTNKHMFMGFKLGTWLIVGIYPDGTIASFSPWSLVLKAYETKVSHDQVFIKICSTEMHHEKTVRYSEVVGYVYNTTTNISYFECEPQLTAEFYVIPGFGRVLVASSLRTHVESHNLNVWVQYCQGTVKGCSWIMTSIESTLEDSEAVPENDLRFIAEFIKVKRLKVEVILCPDKYASRNLGILIDMHSNRENLTCWSPFGPFEGDHYAKNPAYENHRELDSPLLDPIIGQWVQFDVLSKDLERYMGKKPGYRLSISEYLPINSPCGIGVLRSNRTIRIAVSCILVTGTDHSLLYELPTFGYVIDPKSSLVSGAHMQLIIEKTSWQIRRISGACWKVVSSMIVDPSDVTVEKTKDIRNEAIPLKHTMLPCKVVSESQPASTQTKGYSLLPAMPLVHGSTITGVVTLKYQQPHHQTPYHEPEKDYYAGNHIRLPVSYSNSARSSRYVQKPAFKSLSAYSEKILEVHGIVEKVSIETKSGILWVFDDFNASAHFIFDDFGFVMGNYVYATLEKQQDLTTKAGYKWKWLGGVRKNAPFRCHIVNSQLYIETELECISDSYRRNQYRSPYFPTVIDVDNLISNPSIGTCYPAMVWRKKMPDFSQKDDRLIKTKFVWSIFSLQNSLYAPKDTIHHNYGRSISNKLKSNISSMTEIKRATSSDLSSVSPPLHCQSLPSSEE